MASVELVALHKSFAGLEVIKDVNLTIAEGEFIALVGPSGCGKSTLLRIIVALDAATSGDILMDGAVVNDDTPPDAQRGHGVSVLCALPAYDGAR